MSNQCEVVSNCVKRYRVQQVTLLTLGAHAQEDYGTCLVRVCMSVTTLASTAFVSTFQVRYVRLLFRLFSIFKLLACHTS